MTFEKINIEKNAPFDLPHAVGRWCNRLTQSPSLTESDSEELKGHLLDTIDDLKAAGLDDEEAFWVASKRLGVCVSLDEDYETVNRPLIQMRKSLILLAGGFFLFCFLLLSPVFLLFAFHWTHDCRNRRGQYHNDCPLVLVWPHCISPCCSKRIYLPFEETKDQFQ